MNSGKFKTNRDRFKYLAVYRTNQILKSLSILGNCSNRSAYEYTEEEINRIFAAIEAHVQKVRTRFYFPSRLESKDKFSLNTRIQT